MARKPSKKRRKDGRFCVMACGEYFYSRISYADAARQAKEYRAKIERGLTADAQHITVRQYAARWIKIHKSNVSEKTYSDYAQLINKMIDVIGDYACIDITPDDAKSVFVQKFKPKKTVDSDGYSGSTIRRARMLYINMFDAAVENHLCTSNPFRSRAAIPQYGVDGTHREITAQERQLIHDSEHWFKPAVMAMLYAGLRRGEALAIDLSTDVSPDGAWLNVRQAVRFAGNQPVLSTPKTSAGTRTVPIFLPLRPYLTRRKGLLVPSRQTADLLSDSAFQSAWNSFIRSVETQLNGVSRRWYGLTKAAKAEHPDRYARYLHLRDEGRIDDAEAVRLEGWREFSIRPHDLRHSYCTMLRDAGVDMKQTIEWMGHADEKMILKIYDHPGTKRAADSIEKVQSLLDSSQNLGQRPMQHFRTIGK